MIVFLFGAAIDCISYLTSRVHILVIHVLTERKLWTHPKSLRYLHVVNCVLEQFRCILILEVWDTPEGGIRDCS